MQIVLKRIESLGEYILWHINELGGLSLVVGLALADTFEALGISDLQLKWPNDILIRGKKVAGLLNEMNSETEGVRYIVLGIGVNLNMAVTQFPTDLRYPATAVALETGAPVSRLAFARTLFRHLDQLYLTYLEAGFAPVISAWEKLCDLVGRQVEVDCQSRILLGTVTGLDSDGALLVRTLEGVQERILAGDVRPL